MDGGRPSVRQSKNKFDRSDSMIDSTEGAVIEERSVISEIWDTRWMPMELS